MRWPLAALLFCFACTHSVTGTKPTDGAEAGDDPGPSDTESPTQESGPSSSPDEASDPTTTEKPTTAELGGDYCAVEVASVAQCKASYGAYLHLVPTKAGALTGTFCEPEYGPCSSIANGATDGTNATFVTTFEDGPGIWHLALTPSGGLEGTLVLDPYPTEDVTLYPIR